MFYRVVGEKYCAVANYVMKYVTKAEQSSRQSLFDELSAEKSLHSQLRTVARRMQASRETSVYEATASIEMLQFYSRSRSVQHVSLGFPCDRRVQLLAKAELESLQLRDPESTKCFKDNMLDTYYPQRPAEMEKWTLFTIYSWYDRITDDKLVC